MHRLLPHPDARPRGAIDVRAGLERDQGSWMLSFRLSGRAQLVWPEAASAERTNDLWKATCFELFVRSPGEEAYAEFNFSPSTQWAAYAFDTYRSFMRDLRLQSPPVITAFAGEDLSGIDVSLEAPPAMNGACEIGLSAVIEEACGVKSCWALRHPPGKADFHHGDCFALALAAPNPA